jgi:hypothetical protein
MSSSDDPLLQPGKQQLRPQDTEGAGKPPRKIPVGLDHFPVYPQRWKRATDLILPPIDRRPTEDYLVAVSNRSTLAQTVANQLRTCCIKTANEKTGSRGALLVFRGRCVGAIYTSKLMPEPQPTEQSLRLVLAELVAPAASIYMYDLPEDLVLPLSTLFRGAPIERSDKMDSRTYFDQILTTLMQKRQTACIPISIRSTRDTVLGFVHRGVFVGAFHVDQHRLFKDLLQIHQMLHTDPESTVYACVFADESATADPHFGLSLV